MNFKRFAWGVLGYNIFVILWGALVRATGSGAGCGKHWPLCNGEVIPRSQSLETMIEFSHRLTSGIALLLVLILFFWARRKFETGRLERKWSAISLVLILIEALIGAGLVLLELVADNSSAARAFALGLHLANTFFLLASLSFVAWYADDTRKTILSKEPKSLGALTWLIVLVIILGITGAITALGDTIFPSESLAEGFQADLDPSSNFLIKLRILHPVLAILTSIFLVITSWKFVSNSSYDTERKVALFLTVIVICQVVFGFVNLILLVPVWTQIVHLLLADLVWIALAILWSMQKFAKG